MQCEFFDIIVKSGQLLLLKKTRPEAIKKKENVIK